MSFQSVLNCFSVHFFSTSAQILPSTLVTKHSQMYFAERFGASLADE
jgi:hypothetical protein